MLTARYPEQRRPHLRYFEREAELLDAVVDLADEASLKTSGMSDQEEDKILADARKLPLSERVAHKSWKVRSEAYDSIASACDRALSEEDECFVECGAGMASLKHSPNHIFAFLVIL